MWLLKGNGYETPQSVFFQVLISQLLIYTVSNILAIQNRQTLTCTKAKVNLAP